MHDAELVIGDDGPTHRRWGSGLRQYMEDRPEPGHKVAELSSHPERIFPLISNASVQFGLNAKPR